MDMHVFASVLGAAGLTLSAATLVTSLTQAKKQRHKESGSKTPESKENSPSSR